jgi:hypothetical protein
MMWLRTAEAKAELAIPADLTPISAICVGYAASSPRTVERARPTMIWNV